MTNLAYTHRVYGDFAPAGSTCVCQRSPSQCFQILKRVPIFYKSGGICHDFVDENNIKDLGMCSLRSSPISCIQIFKRLLKQTSGGCGNDLILARDVDLRNISQKIKELSDMAENQDPLCIFTGFSRSYNETGEIIQYHFSYLQNFGKF